MITTFPDHGIGNGGRGLEHVNIAVVRTIIISTAVFDNAVLQDGGGVIGRVLEPDAVPVARGRRILT